MTIVYMNGPAAPHRSLIEDAISQHGAMRVLLAAARALFRVRQLRRARPPDVSTLSPRMRRDIGLLPDVDVPDWRPRL